MVGVVSDDDGDDDVMVVMMEVIMTITITKVITMTIMTTTMHCRPSNDGIEVYFLKAKPWNMQIHWHRFTH